MTDYILLITAAFSCAMQNISIRFFGDRCRRRDDSIFLFSGLYFIIAALIVPLLLGFKSISFFTLITGSVFGVLYIVRIWGFAKATQTGPLTVTTLFMNMSLVIPIVFSAVFLGDSLNFKKVIGLLIVLLIIFLTARSGGQNDESVSAKWLVYPIFLFLANGTMSCLQKYHQFVLPKAEVGAYTLAAYISACSVSFLFFFFKSRGKKQDGPAVVNLPAFALFTLLAGLGTVFSSGLYTLVASAFSASVYYPISQISIMIFSTLAAVVIFKERLTSVKIISIALGIVAVFFVTA